MNRSKPSGFTLIELMVVVAIVGILASIAYPSYMDIVRQTRRADAFNALMDIMGRQERYFTDNNAYTTDLTKLGLTADLDADGKYVTPPDSYYLVTPTLCVAGDSSCVVLTAVGQKGQDNDKDGTTNCGTLTLNSQGVKTSTACWK